MDESEVMDGILKQAAGVVQGNAMISSLTDASRAFAAILEDRITHSKATVMEMMKMETGSYLQTNTAPASAPPIMEATAI